MLASGGLDSSVLLAWAGRRYRQVVPLFVASGFRWERAEWTALQRFLERARLPRVKAPVRLPMELRHVYGRHWSVDAKIKAPRADAAWDSVYLPGRNLLLLSRALVYCAMHGIDVLAVGVLEDNPFADASRKFLSSFEKTGSLAFKRKIRLLAPWRGMSKRRVIARGRALPLDATFSCIDPAGLRHCGRCAKCFERRESLREAGFPDRTPYSAS